MTQYSEWRGLVEAACAAGPYDAAPWAVLADWCEERSLPEAAAVRLAGSPGLTQGAAGLAALLGAPEEALRRAAASHALPGWAPHDPHRPESRLDFAGRVLEWADERRAAVEAEAHKLDRLRRWLDAARGGDALALLAHPEARAAVAALAGGPKADRRAPKLTALCPSRRAAAAAKAKMAARLARRAAREASEAARAAWPGRFAARLLAKRKALAVEMGERYHGEVKALYRSAYARVAYGRGGREERDDARYSKGWHRSFGPATCLLAGARLDDEARPSAVVLENHLGREVARLPLPR